MRRITSTTSQQRRVVNSSMVLPPALIMVFLIVTARQWVPLAEIALSTVLLYIPWIALQKWRLRRDDTIPIFAAVSLMFWIYFAIPVFWGDHTIKMWHIVEIGLSQESITKSLLMATVGVVFLGLGFHSGLGRRLLGQRTLDVVKSERGTRYMRIILIVGLAAGTVEGLGGILGSGGRQLIIILQKTVPLVAFAYLLRIYFEGQAQRADKVVLVIFLVGQSVVALASGWVGSVAVLVVIAGAAYLLETHRIPVRAAIIGLLVFLFLQAGKSEFRDEYWKTGVQASKVERLIFWLESSVDEWGQALNDPSGDKLRRNLLSSLNRVSLLSQTANVMELTPSVVPYQGAHLYEFMAVTLIPRFLWPDKPTVNDANRFYQVAFGLTLERDLDKVSIAVGFLTESFIAFGWWGVAVVMFLMGIALEIVQHTLLSKAAGALFLAIGMSLLFSLLGVERQLAQYFGGTVQQIAIILVVMWPVIRVTSRGDRPVPGRRLKWKRYAPQPQY